MCGIAGTFGAAPPDIAAAMSAAIAHRGPDDSGLFSDAGVTFGFRRLSIIDLSPCAHQPMAYAEGRYHIVFNGEIYNFADLRRELESLGHRFASHSDTEVILAAYAQWGDVAVTKLRGMFAFAIFDRDSRELFLARDRFGIKPLYFTRRGDTLLFASELKALLASGLVPRRLDPESLWIYLALGSMPQPRTALCDVTTLPPGHTMRVRPDLSFTIARYWDLAEASVAWTEETRALDAATAARRLRELLEEATRLHMIADVPVGAFLSGGIDSTAVVGLMSRRSGTRIRTFSVGFDDDTSVADERKWARLSAQRFDTEHTEVVVSGQTLAGQFDALIDAIDQPSLDGTNTWLVAKAASSSLKVALSGLGGDELFAGYAHFGRFARAARWERVLGGNVGVLRRAPGRLMRDREFVASGAPERFAMLRLLADEPTRAAIAAHPGTTPLRDRYPSLLRPGLDPVAQTTYVETSRYLVDTLLRDADAMAMHSSLEVRPVLLDHVLAEFAFALPAKLKLNGRGNKPVLVDAVRDLLPPELLTRPKTGFELPLQSWLAGPLRERAIAAFSSEAARSVFSKAFLDATSREMREGRRPALRMWAYVILVEWMQRQGVSA